MVNITDVKQILQFAIDAEIKVFLDGGWGVDALLGHQSRSHFGGYKLLPDIITETRNYNISANASAMQYPNDSEELTLMVKAYLRNPVGNYRETVSKEAARIIETHVISFNASVKYIVALGKRDFLYDAYYRHINRFARKGDKIYD